MPFGAERLHARALPFRFMLTIRFKCLVPLMACLWATWAGSAHADQGSLQSTIAAQDRAAFDAFNKCADPDELKKHASYFAEAVEFYHDTGGVTWTRDAMLSNTAKHACGVYRRELVPGTLKVFPVKDFGAISQGTHRFCSFAGAQCEGLADFTIVWQQSGPVWRMTRVLSYGHRPAK